MLVRIGKAGDEAGRSHGLVLLDLTKVESRARPGTPLRDGR
jgi:hypothetical protein